MNYIRIIRSIVDSVQMVVSNARISSTFSLLNILFSPMAYGYLRNFFSTRRQVVIRSFQFAASRNK